MAKYPSQIDWPKVCKLVVGVNAALGLFVFAAYRADQKQQAEAARPPRWTDAARWEKKGRDY